MADPAPADGRSGDIRWPIQHRLMADPGTGCWPIQHRLMADQATSAGRSSTIRRHPLADPAPADGRSGDIRWPIQHRLMADQARSRIRDPPPATPAPRVRVPYGN
jgi:hypothetical protein